MTESFDITKVKKVYKTNIDLFANAYLDAGWILLNTTGGDHASFILGWNKDSDPVTPEVKIDF